MGNSTPDLEDTVGAGFILVAMVGVIILFSVTDFHSAENAANNASRFMWAMVHTIAPTSELDLAIEIIVTLAGGLTIGRVDVRMGIVAGIFLYGVTSFILAWFAAPV